MRMVKRIFDMFNPTEEDFEEDFGDQTQFENTTSEGPSVSGKEGNVIKIGRVSKKLVVSCFKPARYDSDISKVVDRLRDGNVVILDLGIEASDSETSKRIIDFMCGAVYALEGKLAQAAKSAYVLTPRDVEINGVDIVNKLNDSGIYI